MQVGVRWSKAEAASRLRSQASVLLHRPGRAAAYEIFCERSFAEYLWLWLEDAALEFTEGA